MPFKAKKAKGINTGSLEELADSVLDLAQYTEDEFAQVASSFQLTEPETILFSAPPKPRRGTVIYADGTSWNPGFGEGLYSYNGSLWVPSRGDLLWNTKQSLSAAQISQIWANIGPPPKNYVMNGAMVVSQENGPNVGTTSGYYPVDHFFTTFSNTTAVVNAAQVTSYTPGDSPSRARLTVATADPTVGATDFYALAHMIEGIQALDLRAGTSAAKTITIQFGCKGPAGTYCLAVMNGAQDRHYICEYTIAAGEANTDVVKSVTLPLDQTGTWLTDTGRGIDLFWIFICGSSYQTAPNVWGAGNLLASANQVNFMATVGNVFELFDVGLYEGSSAPPFQVPDYIDTLLRCRRYFNIFRPNIAGGPFAAGEVYNATLSLHPFMFPTRMRVAPTCSVSAAADFGIVAPSAIYTPTAFAFSYGSADSIRIDVTSSAMTLGPAYLQAGNTNAWMKFNARL